MKSVIFLLVAALALGMASCGDTGSQPNDGKFSVTYHENGQSVTVPPVQEAAAGSTVYVAALPGSVPAGKVFDGWNTHSDGSGDFYGPGAPLVVNQNIDLYAEWATSGGGGETGTGEYTVTMEPFGTITGPYSPAFTRNNWEQVCYPNLVGGVRVEKDEVYSIAYSFKSNIALSSLTFFLADNSLVTSDKLEMLGSLGNTGGNYEIRDIQANTEVKGTIVLVATVGNAANDSELANCLLIWAGGTATSPTLTFTELTLQKAEKYTLRVGANGSSVTPTSQLTLTFDKPITGLTSDDIDIQDLYITPGSGTTKGALSGSGLIYVLNISTTPVNTRERRIYVRMQKQGYFFSYTGDDYGEVATIYTAAPESPQVPPAPPIPTANLVSVSANGNTSQTTTELTLVIEGQITGLTSNDIFLQDISVTKNPVQPGPVTGNRYTYILPIRNVDTGGTLRVSVSKSGYSISGSPKTVTIYRDYRDVNYQGFLGRGYNVLESEFYRADRVKTQYALNMPKLIAEGRYGEDTRGVTSVDAVNIVGKTINEYATNFSGSVGASGGVGLFSASVSFGYSSSNKAQETDSFASCIAKLTKEKHYVDMSQISLANIRDNYLTDTFKNNLLNNSYAPATLFQNYGTHIFNVVYLGGRIDMGFVYRNTLNESAQTITTKFQASYGTVSGTASAEDVEQTKSFVNNSTQHVRSYGGSAGLNFSSFQTAMDNYTNWARSIENKQNLTIIDGGNLSAELEMIPVWELVDKTKNSNRYNALKNEYNRQLDANSNMIMGAQPLEVIYLDGVYMGVGTTSAQAKSNLLSKTEKAMTPLIPGDLNHGVNNQKYLVYLGFTRTANESEAITNIIAVLNTGRILTTRTINGITYTMFGDDANKGVTGVDQNHIWLYYTKDTRAGKPLKNLFVELNYNGTNRTGTGWKRVQWADSGSIDGQDADMNKGVAGTSEKTTLIYMQR